MNGRQSSYHFTVAIIRSTFSHFLIFCRNSTLHANSIYILSSHLHGIFVVFRLDGSSTVLSLHITINCTKNIKLKRSAHAARIMHSEKSLQDAINSRSELTIGLANGMNTKKICQPYKKSLTGWRRDSVVKTSVFGWRTSPALCLSYG